MNFKKKPESVNLCGHLEQEKVLHGLFDLRSVGVVEKHL
jgi:hypothetical protein